MEPMEARPIILDVDTGIDDMVALLIAATAPEFPTVPAPQYFGAHVDRHPGELTVVALGPLTNLAAASQLGVDMVTGLREVIWMGGTLRTRGNTTQTGEWNACGGPEAP